MIVRAGLAAILIAAVADVTELPAFRDTLVRAGFEPADDGAADVTLLLRPETERSRPLVTQSGLRIDQPWRRPPDRGGQRSVNTFSSRAKDSLRSSAPGRQ